ncbi:MAG: patatin-like phospholipase family protein [Chloroflexi bacterium]|nr:patatin-like phospholipase family protein [Chloroflexota bacterium]
MRTLKLGLALGAGGTKGAAHVGVMRVLADAGIKPDVIAGTSIGSLYGGIVAVGRSPHEIEDGIRTRPHREVYTFFRQRLKVRANNTLARAFYEALAGFHIEDLEIPYAAVASDMVERKPIAITRGPIIDAIEASIAIPLIARPVAHQGRFLLDGGFWDAAPVNEAHQLGADVIVSVELGQPLQLPQQLRAAAVRAASLLERVPMRRTLAGVPFTVHAVTSDLHATRTAHVVLRPEVPHVRGNSPSRMVDCLEAGAAAAEQALPAIQALLAGETPAVAVEEYAPQGRLVTDPGLA